MNASLPIQQIRDQAASTVRAAIENANLDRALVTRSFAMQLEALKLPARPVIFHPNLNVAVQRVNERAKEVKQGAAAWDAARAAAWDAARAAAWDAAWAAAWDAARAAAWAAAWAAARAAAWDAAWDAARAAARAAAWDAARAAAWDAAWAAARAAAWDAARAAAPGGAPPRDTPYDIATRTFLDIIRGGTFIYWIAPDAVHVVLARIRTLDNRLHCDAAPAIQYEDGSGLYYWHGIQVPELVIMAPYLLRVQSILDERNAEVRRAMIERYGQDRFMLDSGAKSLDTWNGNDLLAIDLPEDPDERMVALKLRCPSTQAVYIIRVPPNQTTVLGALAWSFGLDRAEDYVLQRET